MTAQEKGSPEKDQKHAASEGQQLGPGTPRPDTPKGAQEKGASGKSKGNGDPNASPVVSIGASPAIKYSVIGNTAKLTISDVINQQQADDAGGKPLKDHEVDDKTKEAAKHFDAVAIMCGSHAQFKKDENKKPGPQEPPVPKTGGRAAPGAGQKNAGGAAGAGGQTMGGTQGPHEPQTSGGEQSPPVAHAGGEHHK